MGVFEEDEIKEADELVEESGGKRHVHVLHVLFNGANFVLVKLDLGSSNGIGEAGIVAFPLFFPFCVGVVEGGNEVFAGEGVGEADSFGHGVCEEAGQESRRNRNPFVSLTFRKVVISYLEKKRPLTTQIFFPRTHEKENAKSKKSKRERGGGMETAGGGGQGDGQSEERGGGD